MGKRRGQHHHAAFPIDLRRLNDRKLMLAQRLADDVEPGREWRIAIALPFVSGSPSVDDAGQGLYRVHQLDLSLGESRGELRDRSHCTSACWPPPLAMRSNEIAPVFDRLALTPWPKASLASSGMSALSSPLALSWAM